MNANMNKKMERGKLLAAAVAIIMIACCITVLATSADADEAPVYQVASTPGEGQYSDIPSAIAAADEAGVAAFTVQLMDDVTGAGFVVESGQNITIDLNGYKYTINSYVGSPGTETNGMQLLQGSTVTIINGSLALATQTAGWVIQNYCDLTLENVKIDGANSGGYALSNNCGNVVLKGETDIIAPADGVAFDVCGFSSYSGVTVTIDESFTGTIDGKIEMTKDAGNNGGVALNINADVEIENLDVQAGDVTVGNGATVTVQEATIADGASLTNNGTLVNNGTVTNNGTLTNNGNLLGEEVVGDVKYKDGTTMQIGDYVYNIFVDTLTLGDKSVVTFAYGIMVPAITFDGQPVEVQDVEPEVIPLTVSVAGATTKLSSYSATFDATLSSIIPEENDGSTGSYQMRVAINLIAESDAQIKVGRPRWNLEVEGAQLPRPIPFQILLAGGFRIVEVAAVVVDCDQEPAAAAARFRRFDVAVVQNDLQGAAAVLPGRNRNVLADRAFGRLLRAEVGEAEPVFSISVDRHSGGDAVAPPGGISVRGVGKIGVVQPLFPRNPHQMVVEPLAERESGTAAERFLLFLPRPVDFDVDGVVHFRIDVDRAEGRVTARIRIERAFSHEAVNARLRAKRAVCPFAFNEERCGFDAGDFARSFFLKRNFEALALGIAHVHALDHARPVLRFRAAGARLDFEVAVGRIHRLVEHSLEFKTGDFLFNAFNVAADGFDCFPVFFSHREVKEIRGIIHARGEPREAADNVVEELLFLAHFLCVLGVVPKIGVFDLNIDFFESTRFAIDVKDTPEVRSGGGEGRRCCSGSD